MTDSVKYHPGIIPIELCQKMLDYLKFSPDEDWYHSFFNPKRINVDINEFPELKKIVDDIFPNREFHKKDRIYFAIYRDGDHCLDHEDPDGETLIALIKKPETGGALVIGSEIIKLDAGDGVSFNGSIRHRVNPTYVGTRISLAIWFK